MITWAIAWMLVQFAKADTVRVNNAAIFIYLAVFMDVLCVVLVTKALS
jgi:hypothetical protein